jgi:outer membrane protein assembly factor BamB
MRLTPVLLLIVTVARLGAEDWPQFRGPTGQGHATERGLPLEWSESHNVLWKSVVPGVGWSSPVVAAGKVWLTTVVDAKGGRRVTASLRALAYDIETGREVVNTEVFQLKDPGVINPKNSRASPTPIVDADRVYVHFGADGTAALSTSGQVLWTARLPYESQHGNGGSPTLYRDLLIVNCDGNGGEAYVVALDTATGKIRWKTPRRRPADQAYSTPLTITVGDRDEVISVGAYRAAAYDPLTGQEIWRVSYGDGFSNVPRPVFGRGLVYIATGFQTPSLIAVRPDGKGDVTRTHVAWTITRGGQIQWQQRLGGNYSASPVFADGRIYFQSEEGQTTVVAPGREFKKLAVNRLDGYTLASMAVSQGTLFIRSHSHLYRIGAGSKP